MENLTALLFLLVSFLGIIFLVIFKIPVLSEANPKDFQKKPSRVFLKAKDYLNQTTERIKGISFYGIFCKILSKIKILSLKVEKYTDILLAKTRKKKIEKDREKRIDSKKKEKE